MQPPPLVVVAGHDDAPHRRPGRERPEPLPVEPRVAAPRCEQAGEQPSLAGDIDRTEHEAIGREQPHGDAVLGQAAQELPGAVEWIDHPCRLAADERRRLRGLLGEPVRPGVEGHQLAPQHRVGGVVRLADRTLTVLVADADTALGGDTEDRLTGGVHRALEAGADRLKPRRDETETCQCLR